MLGVGVGIFLAGFAILGGADTWSHFGAVSTKIDWEHQHQGGLWYVFPA